MRALDDIWRVYSTISSWFANQDLRDSFPDEGDWDRIQQVNDYAYFVLFFAQLETHINDEYEARVGQSSESTFMHRVDVLFNRDSPKTELIGDYYHIRCDIAHGDLKAGKPVYIPRFVADIRKIASDEPLDELGSLFEF